MIQSHVRENLALFVEHRVPFSVLCIQIDHLEKVQSRDGPGAIAAPRSRSQRFPPWLMRCPVWESWLRFWAWSPTVAVEFGRRAIPGNERPTFQDTEKHIKNKGDAGAGGGEAPRSRLVFAMTSLFRGTRPPWKEYRKRPVRPPIPMTRTLARRVGRALY
jgi:hypothetical protein